MSISSPSWFHVDRSGLREMNSHLSAGRLVAELIQNVWDENATRCTVRIDQLEKFTRVTVEDDNPAGFSDLTDSYTLFRSTRKRSDANKRGKFCLGDKIVFACSERAEIITTKGQVIFDSTGRHEKPNRTDAGTHVAVDFVRWSDAEYAAAIQYLRRIVPPSEIKTTLNGEEIPRLVPLCTRSTTLPTELVRELPGGVRRLVKTERKTEIHVRPKSGESAMLFELGLPVVEIEGDHDVDIQQKVPVSMDRTTVSLAYLREVYAELLNALERSTDVNSLGLDIVRVALESNRVTPQTAVTVFRKIYGEQSVIESNNEPDANQEAARHGFTVVPVRTFSSVINSKLRSAGVQTAVQAFGRKADSTPYKPVPVHGNEAREVFIAYVQALASRLYGEEKFTVELAVMNTQTEGLNHNRHHVVFSIAHLQDCKRPVSRFTSLILHELAHSRGQQHDGVYDHEFERLTNETITLAASEPEFFRQFEPELAPVEPVET